MAFAAVAPGLLVSPLAGAFLDRAGARIGIAVDLAISASVVLIIAALTALDRAGLAVLIFLAGIYALTSPLSTAGIRTLLPRVVPPGALAQAIVYGAVVSSPIFVLPR